MPIDGPVALESHVTEPDKSTIFGAYPALLANKPLVALICDTLTLLVVSSGTLEVHAVEEVMDNTMKTHFHELHEPQHALQNLADALPALGIVAAVLGVVKTMGSIDQPPEVLGKLIGGALVGTFLGVFLAYGLVGPFSAKVKAVVEEDSHFYQLIREVLVANLHNHSTNICIEVGRQNTPAHFRPSFVDLEEALKDVKQAAA